MYSKPRWGSATKLFINIDLKNKVAQEVNERIIKQEQVDYSSNICNIQKT